MLIVESPILQPRSATGLPNWEKYLVTGFAVKLRSRYPHGRLMS